MKVTGVITGTASALALSALRRGEHDAERQELCPGEAAPPAHSPAGALFDGLQDRFDPEAARGRNGVFQFRIRAGQAGGGGDQFVEILGKENPPSVRSAPGLAPNADVVISATPEGLLKAQHGTATQRVQAVVKGQLSLKPSNAFGVPTPKARQMMEWFGECFPAPER